MIEELRGKSIFIEGPNFAGKTTLARLLTNYLAEQGHLVFLHRQPGTTALGQEIREILFEREQYHGIDKWAERMLFGADHADFVGNVVVPNKKNKIGTIICDRYNPISNVVYGSYLYGLDTIKMKQLNAIACQGIYPDLIIMLSITEQTMFERMIKRKQGGVINRIDEDGFRNNKKLLKSYNSILEWIIEEEKHAIEFLPADKDIETIFKGLLEIIEMRFGMGYRSLSKGGENK